MKIGLHPRVVCQHPNLRFLHLEKVQEILAKE